MTPDRFCFVHLVALLRFPEHPSLMMVVSERTQTIQLLSLPFVSIRLETTSTRTGELGLFAKFSSPTSAASSSLPFLGSIFSGVAHIGRISTVWGPQKPNNVDVCLRAALKWWYLLPHFRVFRVLAHTLSASLLRTMLAGEVW